LKDLSSTPIFSGIRIGKPAIDLSLVEISVKPELFSSSRNLTYPTYKAGVTTRMESVAGIVAAIREINETTKIYIGVGEGGYNSFSMTEAMRSRMSEQQVTSNRSAAIECSRRFTWLESATRLVKDLEEASQASARG